MAEIVARFEGDDADEHRIPAYEGSQSLQGISRSLILVSHYLVTGAIRKRYPFTDEVRIYLRPPREGSLDAIFDAIIQGAQLMLGGAIGTGLTVNLLTEAFKVVVMRAIGHEYDSGNATIQEIQNDHPGNFEALVDAVEPAVVQGHTAIGNGVQNIVIIRGRNNIVNFNGESKEYVHETNLNEEEEFQDVSVGSLNVNTGYGRVFMPEFHKTVPFQLSKDAEAGTSGMLANSLENYANGQDSYVQIRFRRFTAHDGRTKKLLIYGANEPED